jgi:hypothetical protein
MPAFLPWQKPNDVAWPNFFNWPAITIVASRAIEASGQQSYSTVRGADLRDR